MTPDANAADGNLSEILDLDELAAVESFLTPEELAHLNRDLAEIATKRRRAEVESRGMWMP